MASAAQYAQLIAGVVSEIDGRMEWSTPSEAKVHKAKVTEIQKRLRIIKKELTAEIRAMNSTFQGRKAMVGKTIGYGLAAVAFGRRGAGKLNAVQRDSIRQQQYNATLPYQGCKNQIDSILADLDRVKNTIDRHPISFQGANATPDILKSSGVKPASLVVNVVKRKRSYLRRLIIYGAIGFTGLWFLGKCNLGKSPIATAPKPSASPAAASLTPKPADEPAASEIVPVEPEQSASNLLPKQSPGQPAAGALKTAPVSRTWTDHAGHHVEATFLRTESGKVVLERTNNRKIVSVPLEKLGDEDFGYLFSVGADHLGTRSLSGKVISVSEGDLITLHESNSDQIRIVRLNEIDAPEKAQPFGSEARQKLSKWLLGQEVRVEWYGKDQQDRLLADIYLGERYINLEMVAEGFAWQHGKGSDSAEMSNAEESAKSLQKGLWTDPAPEAPWTFRNQKTTAPAEVPRPVAYEQFDSAPAPSNHGADSRDYHSPAPPSSRGLHGGSVHVKAYHRKDGTYVPAHSRSSPHRRK